jgi:hypothetical protein
MNTAEMLEKIYGILKPYNISEDDQLKILHVLKQYTLDQITEALYKLKELMKP